MSNIITTAVLTAMMVSLLTLTFHNDDALAAVFHVSPWWWALFVHASIIALPPITALLPSQEEKEQARRLWKFALLIALVGNIAGSVSHAAGVTFHQVLSLNTGDATAGVLIASCIGGVLLVTSEYVVGNLWERSIARTAEMVAEWYKTRQPRKEIIEVAPVQIQPPAPIPIEKLRVIAHPEKAKPAPLAPWLQESDDSGDSSRNRALLILDENPDIKPADLAAQLGIKVPTARKYKSDYGKGARPKRVMLVSEPEIVTNGVAR